MGEDTLETAWTGWGCLRIFEEMNSPSESDPQINRCLEEEGKGSGDTRRHRSRCHNAVWAVQFCPGRTTDGKKP